MAETTLSTRAPRQQQEKTAREPRLRPHAWDSGLFFIVLVLLGVGLIALASASYSTGLFRFGSLTYFTSRQAMFAAVGIAAMVVVSKVPFGVYKRFHQVIMYGSLALLVLVLTPLGTAEKGAQRWLFGFQPSELAKLAVIVCFAYWISRDPKSVKSLKTMIKPYGLLLAAFAVLLLLEPHTSATMIVFMVGVSMLFAAGMRLWYFVPVGAAVGGLLVVAYLTLNHVRERISIWLDPFSDMADLGFQGSMSQIAIGSGGVLGLGLGQGRQKHLYLPEPQNDFVFASWCEEMGLIGALIVIVLFACLIYRGFMIARAAPDRFSSMLATGITAKLAVQTLMNLCVVTGVMPVTGASLPFFSSGGTALLMQLGEMGILLNISRYMRVDAKQSE